jgi:hypothetical protein
VIHCGVGRRDKGGDAFGVLGYGGATNAEADGQGAIRRRNHCTRHVLLNALPHYVGGGLIAMRENDGKFVSSQTGASIASAAAGEQYLGHRLQCVIARLMSMPIVDRLKEVEIDRK